MTGSLLFNGSDINLGTVNAHSLKLITGGSERIGIESDGKISFKSSNVGIATSGIGSNTEKLFIQSDSGQSPLKVKANTVDALFIDSDGKVGVGVTSLVDRLEVNGYARFGSQTAKLSLGSGSLGFNRHTPTGLIFDSSGHAYQFQHTKSTTPTSDYLALQVYNSSGDSITGEALVINGLGNVGIGTTNPQSKLSISGSIENVGTPRYYRNVATYDSGSSSVTGTLKIQMPKTWSNTMMTMRIQGYNYNGYDAWEVIVSGYNYGSGWHNYDTIVIGEPPFTSVRLAHDGTKNVVLLGTTSTTWAYPKIIVSEFTAGHSSLDGWGEGWSMSIITSETGITNSVTIPNEFRVRGDIYATAFYYTSDRAKKENITNIDGALDLVKKMQGVGFNFRDDEDKEHKVGFIAQDMELVLPEVVHGENGSMTVDYASVSAVLVEAVKELDAVSLERYKKQQEEIEDLREEMESLRKEVEALKKG